MGALFISLLTLVLILISAFVILLVLMQRTSQSGGMGAALGGGAAESAFGSDTNNVLTKATIYSTVAFFAVSLGLFLLYQSKSAERTQTLNPDELISPSKPDFNEPDTAADVSKVLEGVAEVDDEVEVVSEPAATEPVIPVLDVEAPIETKVPTAE